MPHKCDSTGGARIAAKGPSFPSVDSICVREGWSGFLWGQIAAGTECKVSCLNFELSSDVW